MSERIKSLEAYHQEYERSVADPEGFWADKARQFQWQKPWDQVLQWNFRDPDVKWFLGGKLNITENCLDRHLETRGDQTAILWEPNETDEPGKSLTYRELHAEVCRFANVLKAHGIEKGDRVCLYMPMIPELAISVLACARIGAVHSVVFAGFSASALADRINDASAKAVLTSDGNFRGKKSIPVKSVVDEALQQCTSVSSCIVVQRTKDEVDWTPGRDFWWHEEREKVTADCAAETMDAEDMLFILYTSGSTGKPKGVVHTIGGYMVYTEYSFRNVFQYEDGDIYWCTADIGWITGHSYIIYGPLLAGATTMMFEGVPTYPDAGRFWQIVEKHRVNIFYTAPTAIRALQAFGEAYVEKYDLSSLKTLGSVGEPINKEAWEWYYEHIGKKKCPIVDTWWQTETGGIMISPLAGITPLKPTYATLPLPGVQPMLVDAEGKELTGNGVEGNLCIKFPWPSILRTTYGDHERCRQTYFSTYPDMYFTGDGCRRDEDGYYRILGRVDDVINVSGHRMGTAEVENAINEHPDVIESAVVGYPHEIKGQGIYAFVICEEDVTDEEKLRQEILGTVTKVIGPIAKPDKIQVVRGLPKTRSGKIMRRILRKVAEGDVSNLGDTSTLLDPGVVEDIKSGALSSAAK
ncbi:acetyl-CoA synthetase [Catalinimonas alkaloidigena]|uniref:Acetyl-coenzyme A synthetase n=1 Tax=Catalinimonas alkaloidigena TaxID=1075417 RepID=A0A1G9DC11_9BACT|nr:acetyl-CoA synthetase [Catalinimonas alkaloidigena]